MIPHFDKLIFSMQEISPQQVINKLRTEIELLSEWAINEGDGTSQLFYDKMSLLRDKIQEKEKFEKLLNEER